MDGKVLVILLLLVSASLLVSGCADRRNILEPTITPTATAPADNPGQSNAPSGSPGLDPSLADITGEENGLTGFPETGLPTPTLD
jgi:hypothetical protein